MRKEVLEEIRKLYSYKINAGNEKIDAYYKGIKLYSSAKYEECRELLLSIPNFLDSSLISKKAFTHVLESVSIGSKLVFGFFNKPIVWRVLDHQNNKLFLLSEYGIEEKSLYESDVPNSPSWRSTTIRKWLNGDFYSRSFNDFEKKLIADTSISPDKVDTLRNYIKESRLFEKINHKVYGTNESDTVDKCFLLSLDELYKYMPNEEDRKFNKAWLLRTMISIYREGGAGWFNLYYGTFVNRGKPIPIIVGGSSDESRKTTFIIRPALWLNLDNLH